MSLASWLSVSVFHSAPRLNQAGRRQPSRRLSRAHPFLEHLEERTLLDSSGILPGAATLASNFAPLSIGLALPLGTNFPATTGVTTQTFPTAGGETALAATSASVTQNQVNSQFRDFAVNSQGESNQLFQTTTNILIDAYGFGSGTQPNAPWAPAAYNLGLGNHQFGYPSQSDLGFSATPPWFRPTTQSLPQDQTSDADTDEDLTPESLLIHRPKQEQHWTDEKALDTSEKEVAPTEKPAEEEQTDPEEAAPNAVRGDPATEESLFTNPLHTLTATILANRLSHTAANLPNGKHTLIEEANMTDGGALEDNAIPSPLWISALAPAQMAALVAGLPGVGAPADGANMGSAAGSAE